MTEGDLKAVQLHETKLLDGHLVYYKCEFHRVDVAQGTFCPLEYNTQCPIIPTLWNIDLKYERMPGEKDSYTFQIKLKRKDSSLHRAKAFFFVVCHDVHDILALSTLSCQKDRMLYDDELRCEYVNISSSKLSELAFVRVGLLIEKCHTGTDWRCASGEGEFLSDSII